MCESISMFEFHECVCVRALACLSSMSVCVLLCMHTFSQPNLTDKVIFKSDIELDII